MTKEQTNESKNDQKIMFDKGERVILLEEKRRMMPQNGALVLFAGTTGVVVRSEFVDVYDHSKRVGRWPFYKQESVYKASETVVVRWELGKFALETPICRKWKIKLFP